MTVGVFKVSETGIIPFKVELTVVLLSADSTCPCEVDEAVAEGSSEELIVSVVSGPSDPVCDGITEEEETRLVDSALILEVKDASDWAVA